ncbi:MAG: segregation ATPase FtsK/SpoIIIE, family [Chloroflexota bacterium]|nr:segregation ATPase FtsK/SpoIIIE, family [Chloroflexota bacterium]MEA2605683.1 segregation ATPase FtsK/SpoIIIE, family [Chloroflexota bacterium]
MATKRRTPARRTSTRRRTGSSLPAIPLPSVGPEVARSILGIVFLVLGAVTLIALALPGQGALTDWWRDSIAPWFETGRWLLPFLLLGAGAYLEVGPGKRPNSGWGATIAGVAIAYVGFLGAFEVLHLTILSTDRGGGRIGRFLAGILEPLLTTPGAFVVCAAIFAIGLMIAFNLQFKELLQPVFRSIRAFTRWLRATAAASFQRETAPNERVPTPKAIAPSKLEPRADGGPLTSILDEPAAQGGPARMSQTVWTGSGDDGPRHAARTAGGGGLANGGRAATGLIEAPTALESLQAIEWTLPPVELLDARPLPSTGTPIDHEKNIQRIEQKLLSFAIPAKVIKTNSGPVVTQYEVKPEHHVKLSRIEGLADDLAMALSASSIRIEAPIPGKDVVGIEIPNTKSEIVGFRALVEESSMLEATGPLTFALGRDVSGRSIAVDLAKMPHLLVAGATGSGKSVCINALITSLLMHARPDDVRLILVDLKRVELAPYNGLPHLLQHVIVEPNEAKAVLNWAVREMEERYKVLAGHSVRNIAAYNSRPEIVGDETSDERMPYIVLIIDELADLIMREGRKVEDPIVKIAQKARAVGIHLVLATQRPSVNVVTGLIKANVPSRIAFAMASMIDSRTVLDAPGAEDLIGRGDMLYQPVDLPRPVRMQGVFVGDREVGEITKHWLDQTGGRTFYDEDILAFGDAEDGNGGDGGQFSWLRKYGVDEMTIPAADLVVASNRASTSMLQTKLKLGFSRASRVIDELERYGIVGPQDPRNPASPRQIYGPDNWLRTIDDGNGADD